MKLDRESGWSREVPTAIARRDEVRDFEEVHDFEKEECGEEWEQQTPDDRPVERRPKPLPDSLAIKGSHYRTAPVPKRY